MPKAVVLSVVVFAAVAACKSAAEPQPDSALETTRTAQSVKGAAGEGGRAARPKTKASCDACGGLWAVHGLAGIESCICKTKDADKSCRDGADCEGKCLAQESDFEVVSPGPPARGFYKGKCSAYDTLFGCFRFIPTGARTRKPLPAEAAADQICID